MRKQLTIGLAVLLSGFAANALAGVPIGNSKFGVAVPSFCGGFYFGVSGLWWRAHTDHLDYAVTYPHFNADGTGNYNGGHYHSIDPHKYDWGWHGKVGYIFPCTGNDVQLSYTYNRNREHSWTEHHPYTLTTLTDLFRPDKQLFAPAVVGNVSFTGGSVAIAPIRGTLDPRNVDQIWAHSHFHNNTWDLDFGQHATFGCNTHLRWFAGARYSNLRHNLESYLTASSNTPVTVTGVNIPGTSVGTATLGFNVNSHLQDWNSQHSRFNGIGPRFGVDAYYDFCGGFGVNGSVSTALIIGHTESWYYDKTVIHATPTLTSANSSITQAAINASTSPTTTEVSEVSSYYIPHETRVVPNIDAKLALNYSYQFCNCSRTKLTIEAGWQVSEFFNPFERLYRIGAHPANVDQDRSGEPINRVRHTLDLSYDGPFVNVQVNL